MNEHEILNGNGVEHRRTDLQRLAAGGGAPSPSIQQVSIGLGASNLPDILMGSQVKVDKMMAELSERLATVEARATFREKIVITADTIIIERDVSMAKDRKY
jgi:uncharacterized coiled-coil protein SlyX